MLQKLSLFTHFSSNTISIMQTQNNTTFYNHHPQHQQQQQHLAKQNMFEKPLTPSDVGKLNRLVIPKQYAEKYFPIGRGADLRKGLVLSFEDESGKLWWFRYSYWNSSQSYVLTKGWSRYVKEKRLDAGDVVLFQRHVLDCDRMFIGWRRRVDDAPVQDRMGVATIARPTGVAQDNECDAPSSYPSHHLPLPLRYQPDCLHAVEMYEHADTYQRGEVATRRLRLFGVNLEYQDTSEPSDLFGSSHGGQSDHQYNFSSNNLHHNIWSVMFSCLYVFLWTN